MAHKNMVDGVGMCKPARMNKQHAKWVATCVRLVPHRPFLELCCSSSCHSPEGGAWMAAAPRPRPGVLLALLALAMAACGSNRSRLHPPSGRGSGTVLAAAAANVLRQPLPSREQAEAAAYCMDSASGLAPLYSGIQDDLRHWRDGGITHQHILTEQQQLRRPHDGKALSIMFEGGRAFATSNTSRLNRTASNHARLLAVQLALAQALATTFGPEIPDVEFVVGSADMPAVPTHEHTPGSVPLVLRFCKSDSHADVLIPYFHFHMYNVTQRLIAPARA